jgi:cytochrome b subunit of formate dehydrogenase
MMRFALTAVAIALVLAFSVTRGWSEDEEIACSDCHDVDQKAFEASVHGGLDCTDCHADANPLPHAEELAPVDCGTCHDDVVAAEKASIHANGHPNGNLKLPTCMSCHGDIHAVKPVSDPSSPVAPMHQPQTCGTCHAKMPAIELNGVHVIRPIEAYAGSVHARALAKGEKGATCSSCHSSHSILPPANPKSTVYRLNVPHTCGQCHGEIAARYSDSIHGLAAAAGVEESPVCTDCHGEHHILSPSEPGSPVYATNIPRQTCGRCHGDLRLTSKYDLPNEQVPSYADSYHGLASRAGVQRVANCASCHGVHDILPSSDVRSSVNPANLPETCGRCHPGAGELYAIGPVHVLPNDSQNAVAYWIRAIYIPLIWIVIVGMVLHNLIDFVKKARHPEHYRVEPRPGVRIELRMPLGFRVAHVLVMGSFVTLAFTGFALKYPESWWSFPFRLFEHGTDMRGTIHRTAALVLLGAVVLHGLHLAMSRDARRRIAAMTPGLHDVVELWQRVAYNLGLRRQPPAPVRVGYIEKVEYWAFMWGTIITAASGAFLWAENFTLTWLPGWMPGAATALHLYEAILATLAIAVWHLYWVVFDPVVYPMDASWMTGKPPLARAQERGEVIEETEEKKAPSPPTP